MDYIHVYIYSYFISIKIHNSISFTHCRLQINHQMPLLRRHRQGSVGLYLCLNIDHCPDKHIILCNRGFVRSKHILGYISFYLCANKSNLEGSLMTSDQRTKLKLDRCYLFANRSHKVVLLGVMSSTSLFEWKPSGRVVYMPIHLVE